jgi:hypothetical protein
MCCHPKCREWHAPDHQAWATVRQTSLMKAERARQNRAYVRKLLQERQPEFAAALAAAKEQIVRQRSAPDVTAGHKPEKRSSTGTGVECSETPPASQVSRAANPMLRALFFPQPGADTEALNAGSPAGDIATFGEAVRATAAHVAERPGQQVCQQQVVQARPEPACWPPPRTSRSLAAGSLAGAGGWCWRREQAACSVNLACGVIRAGGST